MKRDEILLSAQHGVCAETETAFGDLIDGLRLVAAFWSAYLRGHDMIHAKDVAAMLCLLRLARISYGSDASDNWSEIAGYAALGGESADREREDEYG